MKTSLTTIGPKQELPSLHSPAPTRGTKGPLFSDHLPDSVDTATRPGCSPLGGLLQAAPLPFPRPQGAGGGGSVGDSRHQFSASGALPADGIPALPNHDHGGDGHAPDHAGISHGAGLSVAAGPRPSGRPIYTTGIPSIHSFNPTTFGSVSSKHCCRLMQATPSVPCAVDRWELGAAGWEGLTDGLSEIAKSL